MPERIRLRRTKGWLMPDNTVKVDRSTRWGNPLRADMSKGYSAADAVADYVRWLNQERQVLSFNNAFGMPPGFDEIRGQLKGKNLACWCKHGEACHADALLRIANSDEDTEYEKLP
jgi:Domain of unknown function (DUF4326)